MALNLEIPNLNTYLNSDLRKKQFLNSECLIEQKLDGVKIRLIRISDTGDFKKDWVVSYKDYIQYPDEFDYAPNTKVKQSKSYSQIKVIFNHLEHLYKLNTDFSQIPINTEFFIMFLCNHDRQQTKYKLTHKLVLIGYANTEYQLNYGRILSNPKDFRVLKRDLYAKILKLDTPRILFAGYLNNFEKSLLDPEVEKQYLQIKNLLNLNYIDDYISKIQELFLSINSKYGGAEKGFIVIQNGLYFKVLKSEPSINIVKPDLEYNKFIRLNALNLISNINLFNQDEFNTILKQVADNLRKLKFKDSLKSLKQNKTDLDVKDDIHNEYKKILIKRIKNNNNFLFIGKFRIFTKAHYEIIKQSLKDYDNGVICIINPSSDKHTFELRKLAIQKCFGDNKNITIISHNSGYLNTILEKCDFIQKNINTIIAGTNKFYQYTYILKSNPDINVKEIKLQNINATTQLLIDNIDNELYFKRNTPSEILDLYPKFKEFYTKN